MKDSCLNCRKNCSQKCTEEERKQIFERYWQLGDINRQRDFISKYVNFQEKQRCRQRPAKKERLDRSSSLEETENIVSRRNFTFIYYLPKAGLKTQVCKTFFLNTLNISAQTVNTVKNKIGATGIISQDRRGKAKKNTIIKESQKNIVRQHISSFETVDSHYCRKSTSRRYLPSTLNISKMYTMYEEFCVENNITDKVTESFWHI